MSIPKLIHQLWIGPKPAPTKFMNTWSSKHPDFQYLFWTEADLSKLISTRKITATAASGEVFEQSLDCIDKIVSIEEINGKADIIRWEILYQFGGVFLDADSICIEPFDHVIMGKKAFAGWENEQVRTGLIATGTMGFPPNHPLCKAAIDYIQKNEVSHAATQQMAWQTVGPLLLTRLIQTGLYSDVFIFPSWFFLPIHCTGVEYTGHGKVYAYQEWGSTKKNYDVMNTIELPPQFLEPPLWVSVLVSSYNTKHKYIHECLESIKEQQGHFGIELVWINDGSNELATALLERVLDQFRQTTRFCRVVYHKMEINRGISTCLNRGILMCSNELVVKHDSDDIMKPHRIKTQLAFVAAHPDCVVVGSNVSFLRVVQDKLMLAGDTHHPATLTWDSYKATKPYSHWIMNHPSLLYKRSAVLAVGNYSHEPSIFEDFELELKLLKQFGKIYNITESLVLYRLHPEQVTYAGKPSTPENVARRTAFIESLI
jgi:mannosyltransferase OCH1-like enzyme